MTGDVLVLDSLGRRHDDFSRRVRRSVFDKNRNAGGEAVQARARAGFQDDRLEGGS